MSHDEDKISVDIRALVGRVVSELIKGGGSVHFHDITQALFRLSEETRDDKMKALCKQAITFFSRKMH